MDPPAWGQKLNGALTKVEGRPIVGREFAWRVHVMCTLLLFDVSSGQVWYFTTAMKAITSMPSGHCLGALEILQKISVPFSKEKMPWCKTKHTGLNGKMSKSVFNSFGCWVYHEEHQPNGGKGQNKIKMLKSNNVLDR